MPLVNAGLSHMAFGHDIKDTVVCDVVIPGQRHRRAEPGSIVELSRMQAGEIPALAAGMTSIVIKCSCPAG